MTGPEWLADYALSGTVDLEMPEECRAEMKLHKTEVAHGLFVESPPPGIGQLMKCKDYSSFHRLLSVTSVVVRFCRTLLGKVRRGDVAATPDDLTRAETLWIAESQKTLPKDKNFSQWKKQFGLFQDDNGIWRCGGRIQNADVSFSTMHPILLARDHYLTTLLVRRAHQKIMHSGVGATLTELRSQFWILKGRSLVRRILNKCVVCRRFEGRPYQAPPPPPLPPFRVQEAPPFAHTGVDFAGPVYVKGPNGVASKAWICLYTCCVTRAVHLDLVTDLSTPTFIRSLKRFTARRGLPTKMISDNGRTFKSAAKVIHSIVTHRDVQQYLAGLGVKWIFNLPKAPWWGGIFERLVGSTKRCLRKVIGQARFSWDELWTAVVEAEAVINSRPLTYIMNDDTEEPLTPSHLLTGRRILSLPDHLCQDMEEEEFEVGTDLLTRRARHLNSVLNRFWERWKREYLLELRESHRYHRGHINPSRVSVDDVVVVHSTDQPRGFWKLGRIMELLVGRDGEVRGAVVRVTAKGRQATVLQRPIQLLYPLEVPPPCPELEQLPNDPEQSPDNSPESPDDSEEPQPPRRPRRAAALEARDKLLAQTLNDN